MPNIDLTALSVEELDQLRQDVGVELERRRVIEQAPKEADRIAEQYTAAVGRRDGDDWKAPEGAFDAYHVGAIVTHKGQAYRNDHTAPNPWEPGTVNSNWTPVWPNGDGWTDAPPTADDGSPAAWLAGVAYKVGDRVTHDGAEWECVLEHVSHDGWKPGPATYAVWKRARE